MTADGRAATTREIVVEELLPHSPSTVWKTLTTAELIGRWLMPNDFELSVGKKFTFRSKPMGDWDGLVYCEVLDVLPNERLAYSWRGGSAPGSKVPPLDSVVTWTLTAVDGGTRLRLVHSGFRSPENDMAFNAMSPGWGQVMASIGRVAAEG
ncbi:MAG: SRPBCC domain-containing protein [Gemmatimonadaceae bacterium]